MKNFFPILLTCLDFVAAIVYAFNKDWCRVIYWIAAGILTLTTIFMR